MNSPVQATKASLTQDPCKLYPVKPRQRILTVLSGGIPDRVPYYETGIHPRALARLGIDSEDEPAISRALCRDNIVYRGGIQPPWNCEVIEVEGASRAYAGKIKTRADLSQLDLGPTDLSDVARDAEAFNARKGDFASCGMTTLGLSTMILSMGYENLCYAIADDPDFVTDLLDRFVDDSVRRIELANQSGFDMYQVQEDIAFNTGPYVSPQWYAEVAMPRLRRAAEAMAHPWVHHSDGDITSLIPYIVELGAAAINPIEPAAMDLRQVKQQYGDVITLSGNVDLALLERGSLDDIRAEIARCMRDGKPGGRYLISSSNSITADAQPENVLAMVRAIQELGAYV